MACCLWGTFLSAYRWRKPDISICSPRLGQCNWTGNLSLTSQAPPPATMLLFRIARFTIIIASCKLRSTSAMNCSAPPLRTKVHVLAAGHPSKKLNLSPPICRSSNCSQVPRCCDCMSEHVDDILPPHACTTRSRSSELTRPAQKTSRSAKYLLTIST